MPMHDWSRIDAGVYHHFHQAWAFAICDALNDGRMPDDCLALVEQWADGLSPDVLSVQDSPRRSRPVGTAVAEPPRTRFAVEVAADVYAARADRVVVSHEYGEVVCIIEIVSPSNKASRHGVRMFLKKSVEFLSKGVNLLVVDPFPPTRCDPAGMPQAIIDRFADRSLALPADKPLSLSAFVAHDFTAGLPLRAFVEPVAVGDTLPDMPVYLDAEFFVMVSLEAAYAAAWLRCPPRMRRSIESAQPGNHPPRTP